MESGRLKELTRPTLLRCAVGAEWGEEMLESRRRQVIEGVFVSVSGFGLYPEGGGGQGRGVGGSVLLRSLKKRRRSHLPCRVRRGLEESEQGGRMRWVEAVAVT